MTAAEVATISAKIDNRQLNVSGHAWWLPAAGELVCWAVTVADLDGGNAGTMYGAAGPAGSWMAAVVLGQDELWRALHALQPEARAPGARGGR